MKKIILLIILASAALWFFLWRAPAHEPAWGITFSQKHAEALGLDWKETYLALLDDLGARNLRLVAYWELVEPERDEFYFDDLDFQVNEASFRGAGIILAVGLKSPRWPECHIPEWARALPEAEREERVIAFSRAVAERYKNEPAVSMWQAENEPFFPFGECPPISEEFVAREVAALKAADPSRRVMITDTGEWSLWTRAASLGDAVGVTMYRTAYISYLKRYISFPFPPAYYRLRALAVEKFFKKSVIPVEVQAEPWFTAHPLGKSDDDWKMTLDVPQFKKNISYARATGFSEIYLWGAEWWWYMKEKRDIPDFWEEAKKLF